MYSKLKAMPRAKIVFAAAAAKSLQLCPTLCDPIDGLLPGSSVPGILQARTLEWVTISYVPSIKFHILNRSCVPDLLSIFITLLNFVKCLFLHLLDSNVFVWFCSFFY